MEQPEATAAAESTAQAEPVQPSFTDALQAEQPSMTAAAHEAALAKARTEWDAEQGKTYGWAKDIAPEHGPRVARLYADADRDPAGTAMAMLRAAAQNPANHAAIIQQIQSFLPQAGPAPASAGPQPAAAAAEPPGPDLVIPAHVDEKTGQVVPERRMYSAEQMAEREKWLESKLTGTLNETLKPVLSWKESQEQQQQQIEAEQQADTLAREVASDLAQRPMFTEHKKEIAAEIDRMAKAYPGGIIPDARIAAVARDAYFNVVLPKLTAQGQSEALADHARRAGASTARPTSGRAATPSTQKPASFAEALRDGLTTSTRSA